MLRRTSPGANDRITSTSENMLIGSMTGDIKHSPMNRLPGTGASVALESADSADVNEAISAARCRVISPRKLRSASFASPSTVMRS